MGDLALQVLLERESALREELEAMTADRDSVREMMAGLATQLQELQEQVRTHEANVVKFRQLIKHMESIRQSDSWGAGLSNRLSEVDRLRRELGIK